MRAQLCKDQERSKVLFREFQGRSGRAEALGFNVNQTTNFKGRCRYPLGICGTLVTLLHMVHLFTQEVMERVEIDQVFLCSDGCQISLGMYREVQMVAFVCEEQQDTCSCVQGIIVSKLHKRQEFRPIVLLVVTINMQVLLQGLVHVFSLSVTFRVMTW